MATLKSDKATLTQSFADTLTEQKTVQLSQQQITIDIAPDVISDQHKTSTDELIQQQHHNHHQSLNEESAIKVQDINEILLNNTNENTLHLDDINSENYQKGMASISVSSSSSTTTSSPVLENYLLDLKKVIEWLVNSEQQLSTQADIGEDVNKVKVQFQTHEVNI